MYLKQNLRYKLKNELCFIEAGEFECQFIIFFWVETNSKLQEIYKEYLVVIL